MIFPKTRLILSKPYILLIGGNVIIVIGGDDNYKNEEEEERLVISPWARRIVCVQFSEEYIDGRKSFIFSWGEKHRPIHVEALMHFFDPDKNGEKFKYQLQKQADSASKPARVKPAEPISTKVEEKKCSSDVGKNAQGMGTVITVTILFIVFFPDQTFRVIMSSDAWALPCYHQSLAMDFLLNMYSHLFCSLLIPLSSILPSLSLPLKYI